MTRVSTVRLNLKEVGRRTSIVAEQGIGWCIMETIQDCLLRHARHKCLPYLLGLPELQPYLDEITFILVGSVATGLCTERSDIDIALVCDFSIYDKISIGTEWGANRPSEVLIDGIQLHYYGISFAEIEHRLVEQDDIAIYVYSNAVVLCDPLDGYSRLFGFKSDNGLLRKQRIEGKLDMALRRLRALNFCIDNEEDVLNIAAICLELIRLLLKIIALLDNVQFDPRKRFFKPIPNLNSHQGTFFCIIFFAIFEAHLIQRILLNRNLLQYNCFRFP
jgi:predicted nucleotidyltransferase